MTNKALSIFNQLRPVSIGFDNIFDHFERMFDDDFRFPTVNYPPYNIVKTGTYTYNIEVALAGYNKKDISVEYADGVLTIKSIKEEKSDAVNLVCNLTGDNSRDVVSFGTEAGLFQEIGISTVVCGPGSIEQAHKIDEHVSFEQLKLCLKMLIDLKEQMTN